MSLVTCPWCQKLLQSDLSHCPWCKGRRPDKGWQSEKNRHTVLFLLAIVAILVVAQALDLRKDNPSKAQTAPSAAPKTTVENSPWDGSVRQVERYLKDNLKDPDSLDVISWSNVLPDGDGFKVRCSYRAKNSFGGFVVEEKIFLLNSDGRITGVLDY